MVCYKEYLCDPSHVWEMGDYIIVPSPVSVMHVLAFLHLHAWFVVVLCTPEILVCCCSVHTRDISLCHGLLLIP